LAPKRVDLLRVVQIHVAFLYSMQRHDQLAAKLVGYLHQMQRGAGRL
jgi:hypothetical protein